MISNTGDRCWKTLFQESNRRITEMTVKKIMQTDFLTFKEEDEITKVVGSLIKHKKRNVVVLDNNGNYLGLVSRRKLLSGRFNQSTAKNAIIKTPIVLEDLDLMSCAKLMHATGVKTIPVERKGKLVGIVRILDVLKELSLELSEGTKKVASLKLAKPNPLKSSDTVAKALAVMVKQKIDNILVFKNRKLEGVLSIRDVMKVATSAQERISNPGRLSKGGVTDRSPIMQMPIASFIITGPLLTVKRENKLMDAVALMHERNIRDLIVQEGDKIFGLVTVRDLLDAFVKDSLQPGLALNIRGLKKLGLHDMQEARFLSIIRSEALKLQRKMGEEVRISLDMKLKKATGASHQYELKLKVDGAQGLLMSETVEWKLDSAIRSVFRALALSSEKKAVKKGKKFSRRK